MVCPHCGNDACDGRKCQLCEFPLISEDSQEPETLPFDTAPQETNESEECIAA